jgi:hypothetical protein
MDIKQLIQQMKIQKDTTALSDSLKTRLAVIPETAKVGEELKVIGFKGENFGDLYLICTRGQDEVYELKYTLLIKKSQDGLITPNEIECDAAVQEKYKDKLQFIYSIAKNMLIPDLIDALMDKTIVLAGEKEVPATFRGVATKTKIKKFALITE